LNYITPEDIFKQEEADIKDPASELLHQIGRSTLWLLGQTAQKFAAIEL